MCKINYIEMGPAVPKQSWKKRLKDWKNAIRAKYRKIAECRITSSELNKVKTT